MTKTRSTLFPAKDRDLHETAWLRSWNTFLTAAYPRTRRQPVGNLYLLNDDALESGHSLEMQAAEDSCVVLLPLSGSLAFRESVGSRGMLAAGQAQFLLLSKERTLVLSNPSAGEPVNFLQAWFRNPGQALPAPARAEFDLNTFQNCLLRISPQRWGPDPLPFSVSIGKFCGHGKTVYFPATSDAGVFVLVLDGIFKVEGRLLHARDGLALYETATMEMEALSNDAIILLVEQPALKV